MDSFATLTDIANRFNAFRDAAGFGAIHTEDEYRRAISLAESIFDATRGTEQLEDPENPLARLLDFITPAIEAYESENYPVPDVSPRELVRFLMEQNNLTQRELPEIGNQSVVSQFLSGKRNLNARQIAALAARFRLSADAFIVHPGAAVA